MAGRRINRYVQVISFILLLCLVVFLTGFSLRKNSGELCKDIQIKVNRGTSGVYLQEEDVLEWLKSKGVRWENRLQKDLDIQGIERVVNDNPYVERADVYLSFSGDLMVEVEQRKPVLKVFARNECFNVDCLGVIMPNNPRYTIHSRICSGHIPAGWKYGDILSDTLKTTAGKNLYGAYKLSEYIRENRELDLLIDQIHITPDNEYELVPKIGNHVILLGTLDDMEKKLERLKRFYAQSLSQRNWNKYKEINLKYTDQVVGIY